MSTKISQDSFKDIKKGTKIQFNATRIQEGNPVTGKFISCDKDSFKVELTKDIVGLNTYWDKGATRHFVYSLCFGLSIVKEK